MNNFADRLLEKIEETGNPTVMGLDPLIEYVPECITKKYTGIGKSYNAEEATALAIIEFNKRLMDCVKGIIPAVKPQSAYYEMLGVAGIKAFAETVKYAKEQGFIVIADAKRNDILSTAQAYAKAFLGSTQLIDKSFIKAFDADAVTINPYLGIDGVAPFIKECEDNGKGIFILVRTSNPSAVDFQDVLTAQNEYIYQVVAKKVVEWGTTTIGESGYSSVGAVVGATWPEQAKQLRKIMPRTIILVPGYGAQGGSGDAAAMNFDETGKGAIVNASRSLMCAYKNEGFSPEMFEDATYAEAMRMKEDLYIGISKRMKDKT